MGGRGASYSRSGNTATLQTQQASQMLQPDPLNTAPAPTGVTQADLANMSDQELHDFLINVNKTDIPDFLNQNHLQRMLYAMGMNDAPEIISQQEFDDRTVNAPFGSGDTVIYRTVNDTTVNGVPFTADDCCDMLTDGDITFAGNGIHGDGLYFSNSLSGSKAYGYGSSSRTVAAVLNSKAKIISESKLQREYDSYVKSHPQTRKALGFARSKSTHDSMSQFALIRGYNVITSNQGNGETYYTVIDRSVLTMTRKRV